MTRGERGSSTAALSAAFANSIRSLVGQPRLAPECQLLADIVEKLGALFGSRVLHEIVRFRAERNQSWTSRSRRRSSASLIETA
jgi:hypothetical protein